MLYNSFLYFALLANLFIFRQFLKAWPLFLHYEANKSKLDLFKVICYNTSKSILFIIVMGKCLDFFNNL